MARIKMFAYRLGVTALYAIVGAAALGVAYTAGDAAYAVGRVVGAG